MFKPLINMPKEIPTGDHPGAFGTKRKHDRHTGIDLYCNPGEPVVSICSGTIVSIERFTGASVGSPWWHETDCVIVDTIYGYIVYGEMKSHLKVGTKLKAGDIIGEVVTVLTKDKGKPMTMLHLELYSKGWDLKVVDWFLDQEKPEHLENPQILLGHFITSNNTVTYQNTIFGQVTSGVEPLLCRTYIKRKKYNGNSNK